MTKIYNVRCLCTVCLEKKCLNYNFWTFFYSLPIYLMFLYNFKSVINHINLMKIQFQQKLKLYANLVETKSLCWNLPETCSNLKLPHSTFSIIINANISNKNICLYILSISNVNISTEIQANFKFYCFNY